jgi:hypothetical protein
MTIWMSSSKDEPLEISNQSAQPLPFPNPVNSVNSVKIPLKKT